MLFKKAGAKSKGGEKMDLRELNGENKTKVRIAGEDVEVNKDDLVKETLKKLLKEKGIDVFSIYVDGEEILSSDNLPETFSDHEIEVVRNAKAG